MAAIAFLAMAAAWSGLASDEKRKDMNPAAATLEEASANHPIGVLASRPPIDLAAPRTTRTATFALG